MKPIKLRVIKAPKSILPSKKATPILPPQDPHNCATSSINITTNTATNTATITKECTACHKTYPLFFFYQIGKDIYCKSCRKDKIKIHRYSTFRNKVINHFHQVNHSSYFQSLNDILPGLAYFKEYIAPPTNTYYHFLSFSQRRWYDISKIYSDLYNPIDCPSISDIKPFNKITKYITREKKCKKCEQIKPTYYIPASTIKENNLVHINDILFILQSIIDTGKNNTQIRYNQFQASYQSYDGWKATCITCLTKH